MGFKYCSMDINDYVFSRRCFMTGEYCSKQLNVQRERERLHSRGEINAFVIMSFTNMSDVVYKWRIKTYVESLAKNLFFKSEEGIDRNKIPDSIKQLKAPSALSEADPQPNEEKKTFSSYLRTVSEKDVWANSDCAIEMTNLCCYANRDEHRKAVARDLAKEKYYPEQRVQKINVIRADSNPSSNFVICNRVCQQMQIADLVVVDVSDENTNVFYELGMAIALRKLILPICYSGSYFAMQLPEGVKEEQKKRLERLRKNFRYNPNCLDPRYLKKPNDSREDPDITESIDEDGYSIHNEIVNDLEHHIDCYPWRRQLFEHFGIRYKKDKCKEDENSRTEDIIYLPFNIATDKLFGFSDLKYDSFPYLESYQFPNKARNKDRKKLGETLYAHLSDSYNSAGNNDNTLVIYSMDRFLNPDEGGQCIANYYRAYVESVQDEHCFCGDRVGLLVQPTSIAEPIKDAEERRHLLYNIGEIVQIGMNQATYLADREMIKPPKYLPALDLKKAKNNTGEKASENESYLREVELREWYNDLNLFIKEYIRNRSFPIYPKDPLYMNRVKSGAHDDLFDSSMKNAYPQPDHGEYTKDEDEKDCFFCLYHIMLRNLKYVNEIVVDITQNSVQSLFWLGVAHASGIYAITIRHDKTEEEKIQLAEAEKERGLQFPSGSGRHIFDISGLWTAVLHGYDTEGFYTQLKRVQLGIEQRNKLMLRDTDSLDEEIGDVFWDPNISTLEKGGFEKASAKTYTEKRKREMERLESFYRDSFWRPMLRRNRLEIYACKDSVNTDIHPRYSVAAWDTEVISALSLYLSKRKLIGEYQFKLQNRVKQVNSSQVGHNPVSTERLAKKSYICIGAEVNPFSITKKIPEYLSNNSNTLKEPLFTWYDDQSDCEKTRLRGFQESDHNRLSRHLASAECVNCTVENRTCGIGCNGAHTLLGQLLLWREDSGDKEYSFRASLAGTSGPATRALSTLFVDEAQKVEAFRKFDFETNEDQTKVNAMKMSYPKAKKKWDDAIIIQWEDLNMSNGGITKKNELTNQEYNNIFPILFHCLRFRKR